eukprot:7068568-Prorocentrum_lima.AAC.1
MAEIRGVTSDQGTEAGIAELGGAVADAVDAEQWSQLVAEFKSGQPDAPLGSCFLMPFALFIQDHLHM